MMNFNKTLFSVVILFGGCYALHAQSTSENFVATHTSKTSGQTGDISSETDVNDVIHSIQYFDGLGRPKQSVMRKASPNQHDIISFHEYDVYGRKDKTYLPYAHDSQSDGSFVAIPTAVSEQDTFYTNKLNAADGATAYSALVYESSPLSRVLKNMAPGDAWVGAEVGMGTTYGVNTYADEVIIWEVEGDSLDTSNFGFYDTGDLTKVTTTDENGNETIQYTNHLGQVILKEVESGDSTHPYYRTYYVYDAIGQLRFVIPPKTTLRKEDLENEPDDMTEGDDWIYYASSHTLTNADISGKTTPLVVWMRDIEALTLGTGFNFDALTDGSLTLRMGSYPLMPTGLQEATYQYQYDGRRRMIAKRVPETGWVYMVYDRWDRLVLTQDSIQRENEEWLFTSYDGLNRPVITGILHANDPSEDMYDLLASQGTGQIQSITSKILTYDGSGAHGYDDAAFPFNESAVTVDEIHTVTYYDNYDFASSWSGFDFEADLVHKTGDEMPYAKGQMTGGKTLILGTTTMLKSVNYYDDRYRLIQAKSEDPQLNITRMTNTYDFVGNMRRSKTSYSGLFSKAVDKWYIYDHMDRLDSIKMSIGSGWVTIQENSYNEIGELIEKNVYTPQDNVLQSTDYDYNIRGWMTHINDAGLGSDGSNDYSTDDAFGMELQYDAAGQLNGNIGQINWSTFGDSDEHNYAYTYDPMNRLTAANYGVNGTGSTNFDVSAISYDPNGNIMKLLRRGLNNSEVAEDMDSLHYGYAFGSNQLKYVNDSGNGLLGFKNGANEEGEYTYDGNGNMISDLNKGISNIQYNFLNLPEQITMGNTIIEYDYLADGTKIANRVTKNGETNTRLYQGGLVFKNDALDHLVMEEGKVVPFFPGNNDIMDYQYFMKDHLGNVRAVVRSQRIYDYEASMETINASIEETYYANLAETRQVDALNANAGSAFAIMDNNQPIGPTLALKVSKGDEVDISVFGKISQSNGSSTYGGVDALVSGLVGVFTSPGNGLGETSSTLVNGFNEGFASLLAGGAGDNTEATGYVTYMLFDENFELIEADFKSFTSSGYSQKSLNNISVTTPGYLITYLSYESTADDQVFFDQFAVSLTTASVIQTDDYYPFGLTFNSWIGSGTKNNYLYNQGTGEKTFATERQPELGVDFTKHRVFDPALGRFWQVDPKADQLSQESWSPYHYAFNNPIRYSDPEGLNGNPFGTSNPLNTIAQGFSDYFQAVGTQLDKAYVSFSITSSTILKQVKVNLGIAEGTLKSTLDVTNTTTARPNLGEFFTPNSDNQPSGPAFTIENKTTVTENTTVSGKAVVEGLDVTGSNTTSIDASTGNVSNTTTLSVGKNDVNAGAFVKTSNEGTDVGVQATASKTVGNTTTSIGLKLGLTIDEND